MTAIQPGSRFGVMEFDDDNTITRFHEKPKESGAWVNGGFFVLKPAVFDYLKDDADDVMWERQPLEDLSSSKEIVAFRYNGFWKCMDTIRDREDLETLWESDPKWKSW